MKQEAIRIITLYMSLLNDISKARQAALIAVDTMRMNYGNSEYIDGIQHEIEHYQRIEPDGARII